MERGGGTLMEHGGGKMRAEVSLSIVMLKCCKCFLFFLLSWAQSWSPQCYGVVLESASTCF